MKKVVTMILAAIAVLLLALSVCATETNDAAQAGEELLNTLLSRQFDAFCTGDTIETDDIFADTSSTLPYREYLRYHTALIAAGAKKAWRAYGYDVTFVGAVEHQYTYAVSYSYWDGPSIVPMGMTDARFTISLQKTDGVYTIDSIETDYDPYLLFTEQLAAKESAMPDAAIPERTDAVCADAIAFYESMPHGSSSSEPDEAYWRAYRDTRGALDKLGLALDADMVMDEEQLARIGQSYLQTLLTRACDAYLGVIPFTADGILTGDGTKSFTDYIAAREKACSAEENWYLYLLSVSYDHTDGADNVYTGSLTHWTKASRTPAERETYTVRLRYAYENGIFRITEMDANGARYLAYQQEQADTGSPSADTAPSDTTVPQTEKPLPIFPFPWFCVPIPRSC